VTLPVVDAGVPEASATDAGIEAGEGGEAGASSDGATSEASIADAATDGGDATAVEAGPPIYVPEAGVTTDDTKCAGSCNGHRACQYPDTATKCGTEWCNTPDTTPGAQLAHMACDGTGHCTSTALVNCTNYACPAGTAACGTTCTSPSDCLKNAFCYSSGATSMCLPRLGNGVNCTLDNQCKSSHCVSGVCCSSDCNVPGGTCTSSGAVGECKCSVNCGDGGTCQLFYRDGDGDGFGDYLGATNGHSQVGCAGSPPAGYVADNTDCNDNDLNVFPGQTAYFGTASTGTPLSGWDYNCDGTVEKSVPEYPGMACEFCGGTAPSSCAPTSACASSGTAAGFGCSSHYRFGFCNPLTHICTLGGYYCGYDRSAAFEATVNCGASGALYTCGTCTTANGFPTVSSSSQQQQCH
jgi:hypothetical protein